MKLPKITIIGAGQVGATTAHLVMLKELGNIVLIDVVDGLAAGKALDLMQAAATENISVTAYGTTDYSAMEGSDFIVITAGLARKPGMTREDLLSANAGIVGPISEKIAKLCPKSIVIVVTNPLDIMTALVLKRTRFTRSRVMGMAGVLDSGRLVSFVASELKVGPSEVNAMVLGSHGDQMVPLKSSITVGGSSLGKLLDSKTIEALLKRTRDAGAEIVSLLKTSSAYYAPASGVVRMVEAMCKDSHEILPVSVWLEGEYGLRDVCIGVPAELASGGVVKIIEADLSDEEKKALAKASEPVAEGLKWLVEHPA